MKAYSLNPQAQSIRAPWLSLNLRAGGPLKRFAFCWATVTALVLINHATVGKNALGSDQATSRLASTRPLLKHLGLLPPDSSVDTLAIPPTTQRVLAPCPNNPDYAALADLFNATNGPAWINKTNWLTDCNPCGWHGVSCLGGRVDGIDLRYNQLVGSLPTSLSALTQLRSLYVEGNQLSGSIPTSLTALSQLLVFSGNFNQLTGSIPASIGNLTQLQGLYLSDNQLTGSLPSSLTALANLGGLNLGFNRLSGPLPTSLGKLTNLQNINLTGNQLSGTLPASLADLTRLQYLSLGANQFTGSLPTSLSALTQLRGVFLSGNRFSGVIPSSLGLLPNLLELYLDANQFMGSIPASLGSLTKLIALDLGYNQLSGAIPPSLGNLVNIGTLNASHNQLSGCFPASLSALCGNWRAVSFSGNPGLPGQGDFARFCATGSGGCALLADLIPALYVRSFVVYGTASIALIVDVMELNSVATNGSFVVKVAKNAQVSLRFSPSATLINNRPVQNSLWTFTDTDPNYYVLSTSQRIEAGDKLTVGLSGVLRAGATSGLLTLSATVLPTGFNEANSANNTDAEKIEYFPQ